MNDKALLLAIFIPIFTLEILFLPKLNHKHGAIITNRGDTIACMLKGEPGNDVFYKPTGDSVYHPLKIENIKAFQYAGNHNVYRAITIPGYITPVYLLLLDTGKINVYVLYEHIGRITHTHLYALKGNSKAVKVFGYNADTDNKITLMQLINDSRPAEDYLTAQNDYNSKIAINTIKIYNGESLEKK